LTKRQGADSPEQKCPYRQKPKNFAAAAIFKNYIDFCEGEDAVKLCQPTWAGKDERQPNAFALATTFGCVKGSDFVRYMEPVYYNIRTFSDII
jgi:hypothetical protein